MKGKYGNRVDLHVKDLQLKVEDGREPPKCQWKVNGDEIIADGEHYVIECQNDKNAFKLSILLFESKHIGKYECIVSTVEEPILSTAVTVSLDSGK